jgi:5-methylcytosine-specific restriction endonuclease McrA
MNRYKNAKHLLNGGAAIELISMFENIVFDWDVDEFKDSYEIDVAKIANEARITSKNTAIHKFLDGLAYAHFYINQYDDIDWIADESDFQDFTEYMAKGMTSVKLTRITSRYRTQKHRENFKKGLKDISNSAFHQIWIRPGLLLAFNLKIAESVKLLKKSDYKYLKNDGVFERPTSFPKWTHNIVKYRERGLCFYCNKNVANSITPNQEYDIDHLVPLAKGGTNDATNLILSCPECNNKKRASIVLIEDKYYWPIR